VLGRSRLPTNRCTAISNLSVLMPVQSTKFTALVVAHVKTEMCALSISIPTLIHSGPTKSMPVTVNGLESSTRSEGSGASICWPRGFFVILHGKPVCKTLLPVWRALRIQNSHRTWDNILRSRSGTVWGWFVKWANSWSDGHRLIAGGVVGFYSGRRKLVDHPSEWVYFPKMA